MNTKLTAHFRFERQERMNRVAAFRAEHEAEIYAIIDCGNYGTSGRYECHVIYDDATVDIFNRRGELITQKLLTDEQLYWNYPAPFYNDNTENKQGYTLYDYALFYKEHGYDK